jgi:hypothetical protein
MRRARSNLMGSRDSRTVASSLRRPSGGGRDAAGWGLGGAQAAALDPLSLPPTRRGGAGMGQPDSRTVTSLSSAMVG